MTAADPGLDIAHLRGWIGRQETADDFVTEAPLRGLAATLDRDEALPEALPPCWHWLYFLPHHRQSALGPDGHAQRGGFLPPVALPRRMWAGSRLRFLAPIRPGQAIRRVSTVADVQLKQGRSGPLVFVKVHHEITAQGRRAIDEEHDIVYRPLPQPGEAASPQAAPVDEAWSRRIVPDDVLLFRYSALTFNGHRIHYDRRYVTEVEGFPGLVVHGPLIATLLLDLVRRHAPDRTVTGFSFKAVHPLYDTAPFEVCGRPLDPHDVSLWARSATGALAMQAQATLAPTGSGWATEA